ncbi:MAG: hypothetical protein JJLCMIEE_03017 [Acidimicrobiales bacterium]|nr:hypothetical protein [Acidimicrobiales bacterium]RIK03281.1 MAG: hypothetical protein DCC48_16790 [Acidobacteriota bacterium]
MSDRAANPSTARLRPEPSEREAQVALVVRYLPDFTIVHANEAYAALMGFSAEQLVGRSILEFLESDPDRERIISDTRALCPEDPIQTMEVQTIGTDGSISWHRWTRVGVFDRDGNAVLIEAAGTDLTPVRTIENALRESEERFRLLADSAPVGVFLIDESGVLFTNAELQRQWGLTFEETLSEALLDRVDPDDVGHLQEARSTLWREGEPLDTYIRLRVPGGPRNLHLTAQLATDADGVPRFVVGTTQDETDRIADQQQLAESEERFRAIVENAADAIVTVDESGTITEFNAAAEQVLGYDSDEIIGRPFWTFVREKDSPGAELFIREFFASGLTIDPDSPVKVLHKDGREVPVKIAMSAVTVKGQNMLTAVLRDVSERLAFEQELEHQATHDALTSLPNRALLNEQIDLAVARGHRLGTGVGLLFADLDRFKLVNDSLGHNAGDELLVAVSKRIRSVTRPTDTVARFGGDEFVVLAEDLTDVRGGVALADRVLDVLRAPFAVAGDEVYMSASIGIAYCDTANCSAEQLTRDADMAMYRAKSAGGDKFEIFDAEMAAWVAERRALELGLRHALDRDELEVHYQTMVRLLDGSVEGVEALVRWRRDDGELIMPASFISVAEETGLIVPLGRQVLRESCRQVAEWRTAGHVDLGLAVNISGRQLLYGDLVGDVRCALADSGLDPPALCLELTESVLLDDVDAAIDTIERVRALGVRIGIDDFGTGYSSLTYLRRFPVDVLKIDRAFVAELDGGAERAPIVSMVIALASSLGLTVVAEGVETEFQRDQLVRFGCDHGQGYFFQRPAPAGEVELDESPQPALGLRRQITGS